MLERIVLKFLRFFYSNLSQLKIVNGHFNAIQPVLIKGNGKVSYGLEVNHGVPTSPHFYNTYTYIEARSKHSEIIFGDHISTNNNLSIVSEKKVVIGSHTLMGCNCSIIDSNFHDLNPNNRLETDPNPKAVIIGENVFLGNSVTILKGVELGDHCVVASGSVVSSSFPKNSVIAGNPAVLVKSL
jgi:acetyltransferase-like isoleucine patch superfamily enzyme